MQVGRSVSTENIYNHFQTFTQFVGIQARWYCPNRVPPCSCASLPDIRLTQGSDAHCTLLQYPLGGANVLFFPGFSRSLSAFTLHMILFWILIYIFVESFWFSEFEWYQQPLRAALASGPSLICFFPSTAVTCSLSPPFSFPLLWYLPHILISACVCVCGRLNRGAGAADSCCIQH